MSERERDSEKERERERERERDSESERKKERETERERERERKRERERESERGEENLAGRRIKLILSSSLLLLSSPELSDTKVYEPQIRALLGTAAHFY